MKSKTQCHLFFQGQKAVRGPASLATPGPLLPRIILASVFIDSLFLPLVAGG